MPDRGRSIDILLRAGVRLGRTPDRHLVTTPVPPELEALVDELRQDLLEAVTHARPLRTLTDTGSAKTIRYAWRRCNRCGAEHLGASQGQACFAGAAHCTGRLLGFTDAPAITGPNGHELPCARPGCQRPATTITAWHEPVCDSDFTHLAMATATTERTPTA